MPSRSFNDNPQIGVYTTDYGDYTPLYQVLKQGTESLIWSSGHYGWQDLENHANVGGSFQVNYNLQERTASNVGMIQGGTVYRQHHYNGALVAGLMNTNNRTSVDPSVYGATLWSKMKPDKPSMQGLNAIYELKDVPGMLKQRFQAKHLHEIGDYYLALKFGWQPLLTDIRNFVITHMKAQDRLKQLIRDEGKPVRRAVQLSNNTDQIATYHNVWNDLFPSFVTYFYNGTGHSDELWTSNNRVWGSARFRYWLPGGPRDVNWTNSMKAKIFGFKPTPLVIYNAIPWSWLIDWFTNLGDLIGNLDTSLVDRLAADYFYVMRSEEVKGSRTSTCYYFREKTLEKVTCSATSTTRAGSKVRMPGDPFGWATPDNSLSGVQLSILGALGLSRLR